MMFGNGLVKITPPMNSGLAMEIRLINMPFFSLNVVLRMENL